jgi:hypothetical protein
MMMTITSTMMTTAIARLVVSRQRIRSKGLPTKSQSVVENMAVRERDLRIGD